MCTIEKKNPRVMNKHEHDEFETLPLCLKNNIVTLCFMEYNLDVLWNRFENKHYIAKLTW